MDKVDGVDPVHIGDRSGHLVLKVQLPGGIIICVGVGVIAADAAVYAQYTENLTTVKISANAPAGGSVTVDGVAHSWNNTITVGVVTGHELTVTPAAGYYFAGWTLSDGADFAASETGEDNTTITVTGLGDGETEGSHERGKCGFCISVCF